jgi:tetratricopeptide (TPR) repeat protein
MTEGTSARHRPVLVAVGAVFVAAGVVWTAVRAGRRAAEQPAPAALPRESPNPREIPPDLLEKARQELEAAARVEPARGQPRAEEAMKTFERAQEWRLAGRAAELAGWDDCAESAYRKAGARPELGRLLFVRAALAGDGPAFAEAARELEAAGGDSPVTAVMLARARGRKDEALRAAREAAREREGAPGVEEFHWLAGLCSTEPEDLRAFDRALAVRPEYPEALVSRAATRFPRGEPHEALADLTEALRVRPRFGEARFHRGAVRFAMREFGGALEDLEEALRIRPGHVPARLKLAAVRVAAGDLEGAIKDYDDVLRVRPENVEAWLQRGLARARKSDFNGAVADFTRMIELEPRSAEAHFRRGQIRTRMGAVEGAVADLSRAIELRPAWAEAFVARAVARERAGDVAGGVADVRAGLKLGLGPDEQREAHDLLERHGEKP